MAHCRYHCRPCGAHFSSLRAFDAHRIGPMGNRRCELGDADLIERFAGVCKIAGETPIIGITVYERPDAAGYRDYRRAVQAA